MQLIVKPQRLPFIYTWVVVAAVIAGSYALVFLTDPAPASANRMHWYVARASGMTAYILLAIAVLLGASSSTGLFDRWKLRKLTTQLHQFSALLVFPFLFFHLWGLHADTMVPFPLPSLFIPFDAGYRALAVGLGILVMYGWILLIVTSYFREKLNAKVWRTIHVLAFPMFIAVTLHGLFSGTDTGKPWAILIYAVPSALFLLVFGRRLFAARSRRQSLKSKEHTRPV
ncbi:hypothetical protein Alches_27510 [Alicyclobacillus hesperidum subsp. aegles]|uniref:ferric reductase-like transmembrane domain-containing protein n=1 Tax=Alicyclobacillus hesperidum TaxID=89784 RepID=UPI0007193D1A|nr:ferric reductase-like transmembrane domain-containing protein [Alicyclobacillus hesperidum]KRW91367.1 hypothetical protein SD51_09225 [Alicyclobacillus tengchongensis]GLG02710.1 hypothetical protein Alches_27510 [Alicyclobacillus hesperidum subsp. aegles]